MYQAQVVGMQDPAVAAAIQKQAVLGARPDNMGVWSWDDTIGRPVFQPTDYGRALTAANMNRAGMMPSQPSS